MKHNWTLSIAAAALAFSAIPAIALQSSPNKSPEQKKTERKIDAAAMTPFMTPHQGSSLKKAVDAGEKMKGDEHVAYPGQSPVLPGADPVSKAPASPAEGEKLMDPNAKAEAAPPAPAMPGYRLMGTVCGTGEPLAVFEVGKDWPSMLKGGDKLEDGTLIVSVSRGKVVLEKIVMPAQPAIAGQEATESQPGVAAQPARPEKRERFELYAW